MSLTCLLPAHKRRPINPACDGLSAPPGPPANAQAHTTEEGGRGGGQTPTAHFAQSFLTQPLVDWLAGNVSRECLPARGSSDKQMAADRVCRRFALRYVGGRGELKQACCGRYLKQKSRNLKRSGSQVVVWAQRPKARHRPRSAFSRPLSLASSAQPAPRLLSQQRQMTDRCCSLLLWFWPGLPVWR